MNFIICYIDGMFQSIFPFKDNKVFFVLSYCAHQIARREDEVLQWTFTEELKQDFPLCSQPYLFGRATQNWSAFSQHHTVHRPNCRNVTGNW